MEVLPVINKTYEVYKHAVDIIAHADKKWKYGLGASIEKDILELMNCLVMAKNAPKPMKGGWLLKASSHQEVILMKFRLFLELKVCNETRIFQVQGQVMEVGRMLGGWLKAVQST